MSFSNQILSCAPSFEGQKNNNLKPPKTNCIKKVTSNESYSHNLKKIPDSVISDCILRAFLDFHSIASFSKSCLFGRNIVRITMNQWRSEGLKFRQNQIECLKQYSKIQGHQQNLPYNEVFMKKIKDTSRLNFSQSFTGLSCTYTTDEIISLIQACSKLQSLNLFNHNNGSELLECISSSGSNLKLINLSLLKNFEESQIIKMLQNCQYLHTIHLARCSLSDNTLRTLSKCMHLTHLDISMNYRISFTALKDMLENLSYLTCLNLRHNPLLGIDEDSNDSSHPSVRNGYGSEITFFEILTKTLPNIKKLNIGHIGLNSNSVEIIPKIFPNLTSLNISYTHLNENHICNLIEHFPMLTEIDYSNNDLKKTNEGEKIYLTLGQNCPNFQSIDLWSYTVTDQSISTLTTSCPNLTQINFSALYMSEIGLLTLYMNCRSLKYLSIDNMRSRYFQSLEQYVEQSKKLIKLNIGTVIYLDSTEKQHLKNKLLSKNPNLTVIFGKP